MLAAIFENDCDVLIWIEAKDTPTHGRFYKIMHVTFLKITFFTRQKSKISDLYFIIRVSTIVNSKTSNINCHLQLCHLYSTLQQSVKKDSMRQPLTFDRDPFYAAILP